MKRSELLIREVDGELLLLDVTRDRVHQLNPSASLIWRLHGAGMDLRQIALELVARFEVDHDQAYSDASETLDRLRALGLDVHGGSGEPPGFARPRKETS